MRNCVEEILMLLVAYPLVSGQKISKKTMSKVRVEALVARIPCDEAFESRNEDSRTRNHENDDPVVKVALVFEIQGLF